MALTAKIGNKTFDNIIGVASGTFGYGLEYNGLVDYSAIGAVYTKTVTMNPRQGNPPPRLIETPSGMLNAIGLANVGSEKFLSSVIPELKKLPVQIVANIAGFTEEEYIQVLEKLEDTEEIWGYEVNISCPNVSHGGIAFGTDPKVVEKLTGELRKRTNKPLIIKLTPNVTDITSTAKAAEQGGADGLTCINTLIGMVIDTKTKSIFLANKTGGLSGPAIRPVGVAITYKVSRAVQIPVIGLGGILTADDAIQYLLAGASAIQIGTGNFIDAHIHRKVYDGIQAFCEKENITNVEDFHRFIE